VVDFLYRVETSQVGDTVAHVELQIIDYAATWHGDQKVICRTMEGPIVESTYKEVWTRSAQCAMALRRLGVRCVIGRRWACWLCPLLQLQTVSCAQAAHQRCIFNPYSNT